MTNQLIKIKQNDILTSAIDARELHNFLEIRKDFSSWIKTQINRAMLTENEDYISFTQKGVGGQFDKIEYYITIDAGKTIGMLSATSKGKEIRDYFIECERELLEAKNKLKYSDYLRKLADEMDAKDKALEEIEELKPFKTIVDNSQAIFSKKEKVYDKEVGYKKDIKSKYPFITNDKLSMILEYYTKSKFKDTNKYIKSELDCIDLFFSECDMEVKPDGKSVAVSHECLLGRNMFVRKEPAIKYLGYCEEDFE
jgi:phage anti-repressor protein